MTDNSYDGIPITPLDFAQIGEVVSPYMHNRRKGMEILVRLAVPSLANISAEEFGSLSTGVLQKLSQTAWAKSLAGIQRQVDPIVSACRSIDPSIGDIQTTRASKDILTPERMLMVYLELKGMDLDRYFNGLLDIMVVNANFDRELLKTNPKMAEKVGDKLLELGGIEPTLVTQLPDSLFPSYKAKFVAIRHLYETLDLRSYFEMMRVSERSIRVLKSVGFRLGGMSPALATRPNAFEIPLPFLSLLDRVPNEEMLMAAAADLLKKGKTRLPEPDNSEFKKVVDRCLSRVVPEQASPATEQKLTHTEEAIVLGFVNELSEAMEANPSLLARLRIDYLDLQMEAAGRTAEGLLWGRVYGRPSEIRCVLLVEGKTEYVAFALFGESLHVRFDLLGVLRVDCEGKENVPPRFLSYKKSFPGIPIICVLDQDAADEAAEVERMLRSAPDGSVCFRLKRGTFEDEFTPEQIALVLNQTYPNGEQIHASDFDTNRKMLPQISHITYMKKMAEFDKIAFAKSAGKSWIVQPDDLPEVFKEIVAHIGRVAARREAG